MNIFNYFKKTKEKREINSGISPPIDDILLQAMLGQNYVDAKKAMNIPAFAHCVHLISETIASLPVKLYRIENIGGKDKSIEIKGDKRTFLLNDDTGDTLNGVDFKRNIIRDYLIFGSAYAYINKQRNETKSINYVNSSFIGITKNTDPIFKDYNILVQGTSYKPFEFLKIIRSSVDGINGIGIIEENRELLSIAYSTMMLEKNLVQTGGNKKGFLSSKNRLSNEAMNALKQAWKNLYSNNSENVIILNEGLSFEQASNTSVEMQMNENKRSLNNAIKSLFGVPENEKDYELFIKQAITPILSVFECCLNRDFLLEREKKSLYFAFDTKEIIKGNIKDRFEAYKLALDSNLMQIDEVRYMEDLEPLNLNFVKLGLDDVLFNPETKEVFTPNTGRKFNMNRENIENKIGFEGGDMNENRN